jgi:hypothetical protein
VLEGQTAGFTADPNQTVADYLTARLEAKELVVKPTTVVRYRGYVTNDLIPALGHLRLDELGYPHIAALVQAQLAAGRGKVTVHRIAATLSSALGDAVRHHRLPANPARSTVIPRPGAAERHPRPARPLRPPHPLHHRQQPPHPHHTQNPQQQKRGRPLPTRGNRTPQPRPRHPGATKPQPPHSYVFHRPDGRPLTVVSKTLRHSTVSTTANIYSHLTAQAAHEAVTTIDRTLTASNAQAEPPR